MNSPPTDAAALAAIDRLLAADPRNVRALILKGDHFTAAGDTRAAVAYYRAALNLAPPPDKVPPDLLADIRRAQSVSEQFGRQYRQHLVDWLARRGFDAQTVSPRFSQSLGILFGEKKIFVQEPRYYYFPGLPQVQFYPRADFPWLDRVEAATDEIRAELTAVLQDGKAFAPYVQAPPNRPRKGGQTTMLDNPDWSAFYLWKNGEIVPENAARCPATLRALEGAPLARIQNRAPSVLFSQLRAGARIPPHTGMLNTRLIAHLPLVVPGKCGFRVGNEVREWEEGRAWVFDDTIEHEAWNESDRTRVILLFDIERPEMTDDERRQVAAMFEAIDAFSGRKPDWEI
jgi:aspartate beta-hydroxylase